MPSQLYTQNVECIIYNRWLPVVESQGGVSEGQDMFSKGISTSDPFKLFISLIEDTSHRKGSTYKHCMVVNLDLENALSSPN